MDKDKKKDKVIKPISLPLLFISVILIVFGCILVLMLPEPPPSINKDCCNKFCNKIIPNGECHYFTQEVVFCQFPYNMTQNSKEFNGTTPIFEFYIFNKTTICGG